MSATAALLLASCLLDDRAIEAAVQEIAGYLRGEELETTDREFFRGHPDIEEYDQ